MTKNRVIILKIILFAMFLALGWLLPFLTGQIPQIGNMLLPMHIPVILGGFIFGPVFGLILGIVTPLLVHYSLECQFYIQPQSQCRLNLQPMVFLVVYSLCFSLRKLKQVLFYPFILV